MGQGGWSDGAQTVYLSAEQSRRRLGSALEGDGNDVDSSSSSKKFTRHLWRGTNATRTYRQFSRLLFRKFDKFLDRFCLHFRIHDQQVRGSGGENHWREIAQHVELQIFVKRRIDCVGDGRNKKRIAVGGGLRRKTRGNVATGTRPVFDNERLSGRLGEFLSDNTGHDVDARARGETNDHANGPDRIIDCVGR